MFGQIPETIDNPILTALSALLDDELSAAETMDLSTVTLPDAAEWLVELGYLLGAERMARQGGPRPDTTNALALATNRLTPDGFAVLIATLHRMRETTPDGPRRQLIQALGFLLAIQARASGRFDPARLN